MDAIVPVSANPQPMPLPSLSITIRAGVMADLPFMDELQKMHTKQVGWMPTKQLEGKIRANHVLIAEVARDEETERRRDEVGGDRVHSVSSSLGLSVSSARLGYLIATDQYFKRDDVGIIYQINVAPVAQRGLIGASLLKAQFERSAYGCKLYCCWCAQDIAANHFWESMGFVPLAFRAGGAGGQSQIANRKSKIPRVHIFWQKRIRAGDTTTPWWFPSKTAGGSIREDRIVLPIPPGTHWSDAKPIVLPALSGVEGPSADCQLPIEQKAPVRRLSNRKSQIENCKSESPRLIKRNGLMYDIPKQGEALPPVVVESRALAKSEKPRRVKRVCDPRLVSAARELRDRWLEEVNASPMQGIAKYEITRAIEASPALPQIDVGEVGVTSNRKRKQAKLLAA